MRIGIFIFKGQPEATTQAFIGADMCLRSIRRHMPGVHVTQLTDDQTPAIPGVDKVLRRPPCPLATLRTHWQSALEGDWVFVDSDVVFQEDVRPVFEREFDVALAERGAGERDLAINGRQMEHNVGVVFSRSRAFWQEIHARIKRLPMLPGHGPRSQSDWFADQLEVCDLARSGNYTVVRLPGRYNYAPEPDGSDLGTGLAAVVHYKGSSRKRILMERFRNETRVADPEPPPGVPEAPSFERRAGVEPLRIFIGYDQRQPVAFNVAAHSAVSRASGPVSVTRLQLDQLPIAKTTRGLTEFTFSRFLAPWLCNFKGWSVFMDADVLVRGDVYELLARAATTEPGAAVHVVGHSGERAFERASVMVFDNERCRKLTPEYIDANAKSLLGLGWADRVNSALPAEWNHLVGYDAPRPDAKLVHFTMGVPCWPQTQESEHGEEWRACAASLLVTCSFNELMGKSVHVPHLKLLGT